MAGMDLDPTLVGMRVPESPTPYPLAGRERRSPRCAPHVLFDGAWFVVPAYLLALGGGTGPGALAGLEPATCCLGDVSVWTLCRSTNFQVTIDRRAKVILCCWRPSLALAAAFLLIGLLVLEELVRLAGGCRCVWLIGWGLKGASVAGL